MTNLSTFPHAIAKASYEVLELATKVRIHKEAIAIIESEIDQAIAFGEAKNDAQRKAAKAQMLVEHESYSAFCCKLVERNEELVKAEISMNLVKNTFTIAKLEARERIAKIESGVE